MYHITKIPNKNHIKNTYVLSDKDIGKYIDISTHTKKKWRYVLWIEDECAVVYLHDEYSFIPRNEIREIKIKSKHRYNHLQKLNQIYKNNLL